MSRVQLLKVFLLVVLLIPGSQAKPARGNKRAFGMGLLGGALAGAVVGGAVAKSQNSGKAAAPATPLASQIVENGPVDANGCYRQTIKEPVQGSSKLYTETVHLVCPNQPAAAAVPVHVAPVAHQPAVMPVAAVAGPAPAVAVNAADPNATATHTVVMQPAAAAAPAPAAVGIPVHVPAQPVAVAQPPRVAVVYASPPAAPTQVAPPPGGNRVILLSKTVKKQRSAAASLNVSHALLIFVVIYCLVRK